MGAQVWNGGITKDQSKEIERMQKRALKIIYKEDDYNKCLQTAELVSLKERRDQMCIQLIKSMSNSDHKLHIGIGKRGRIVICIMILNGELNVLKTVQLCY